MKINNHSEEGYRGILDELKQMCEWGQKIGYKTVITVPTVSLNKVTRSEIHKFGEAYEIIQAVDLENVGITLDCFHLYSRCASCCSRRYG